VFRGWALGRSGGIAERELRLETGRVSEGGCEENAGAVGDEKEIADFRFEI